MSIRVEVCYPLPDGESVRSELKLAAGSTVGQAIDASGVLSRHPEIDLAVHKVGVFGKIKTLDAPLADHDRVEIYRALKVDPKEARQRRVQKTRRAGSIEGRRWQAKEFR